MKKSFVCPACGRAWETVIWAWSMKRSRNEAYCLCQQRRGADGKIIGQAVMCPEVPNPPLDVAASWIARSSNPGSGLL